MLKTVMRSVGKYLPPRLVKNNDLAEIMDTSDEWIQQRTGIKQRYWVAQNSITGPSDLAYEASVEALDKAGWRPEDIDLIIFGTLNPDIFFPGSGCLLQHKLGLDATPSLDIRQQCTSFIYGMTTADAYIKSGYAKRILLVGSEVHSSGLDKSPRGRDVAVLFGDAAAVVCLEGVETDQEIGVLSSSLHTKGEFAESLMIELPAARSPERISVDMIREDSRHYPYMEGQKIFKLALKYLPLVAGEALDKAHLSIDDIDMVIPHQANLRINQAFQKKMNLADEKIFNNIQKYGNTTAASIPLALYEAAENGFIDIYKSTVLFVALGAGVTWGGMVFRFGQK